MFFKKNYFVEFEYEGERGKATCSTTVRCIPSMVPGIPNNLKEVLTSMGHKIDKVYITNIKQI